MKAIFICPGCNNVDETFAGVLQTPFPPTHSLAHSRLLFILVDIARNVQGTQTQTQAHALIKHTPECDVLALIFMQFSRFVPANEKTPAMSPIQ